MVAARLLFETDFKTIDVQQWSNIHGEVPQQIALSHFCVAAMLFACNCSCAVCVNDITAACCRSKLLL